MTVRLVVRIIILGLIFVQARKSEVPSVPLAHSAARQKS